MGDADVNGQGMLETYTRKILQLKTSFTATTLSAPKTVLKKMIVEPDTCVTGEQGGKLLACYLYSLVSPDERLWGEGIDATFLSIGVIEFLEKQRAMLRLFPSAKSLIEETISFYPKLVQGLDTARTAQANAAQLDFGDGDGDGNGEDNGEDEHMEGGGDGEDDGAGALGGGGAGAAVDFGMVRPPPRALPLGPRRPAAIAPTSAHRSLINSALPVRTGGIAQSSFSRDTIRTSCMQSLTASHNFTAIYQAPSISSAFSEKPEGRGRMLGLGQLLGGLQMVQSPLVTGIEVSGYLR